MVSKTNSLNLNIVAASTIGAESINEYFAADSLSIPILLAVVIVTPERDTPGIKAKACESPIKKYRLSPKLEWKSWLESLFQMEC